MTIVSSLIQEARAFSLSIDAANVYITNRSCHQVRQNDAFIDTLEERLVNEFPAAEHPVVRTHPETGRKTLFVNPNFTVRIAGLEAEESEELLTYLFRHSQLPEFQVRFRWEANSIAFWDNRATQHYANSDYYPNRRVAERVAIVGDRPY